MRRLLADRPPLSGVFRPSIESFYVDEQPLYEPSGTGDHLYVTFRKRGVNTRDLVKRVVAAFGVRDEDVGYAGLKDRHATTTQTISVLAKSDAPLAGLVGPDVDITAVTRHGNKLRVGHLRGNRFRLRFANGATDQDLAAGGLAILEQRGLPNFYGDQRFGKAGDNAALGREVLRRGPRAAGPHWKAKLVVSALQSELFNAVLCRRIDAGAFDTALLGDVLQKTESHGLFTCTDPLVDAARVTSFEVSATGPIPGPKMRAPTPDTVPARWEAEALADAELTIEDFARARSLAEGTRRAVRVKVTEVAAEIDGPDLWIQFALPAGAYATVLAAELTGRVEADATPTPDSDNDTAEPPSN